MATSIAERTVTVVVESRTVTVASDSRTVVVYRNGAA